MHIHIYNRCPSAHSILWRTCKIQYVCLLLQLFFVSVGNHSHFNHLTSLRHDMLSGQELQRTRFGVGEK